MSRTLDDPIAAANMAFERKRVPPHDEEWGHAKHHLSVKYNLKRLHKLGLLRYEVGRSTPNSFASRHRCEEGWEPMLIHDVCYALIYPAVDAFMGIASCSSQESCSADGICLTGSINGGKVVPVGWDVLDCGPRASCMSLIMLVVQFWLLPIYWGELTILKLVGVIGACFVISWLYAVGTIVLMGLLIPLGMLYTFLKAWQLLERFFKQCADCDNGWPEWLQLTFRIMYVVFFFVALSWVWAFITVIKDLLTALVAMDVSLLYPIVLVIVLRTPPDIGMHRVADSLSAVLSKDTPSSPILSPDTLRSDQPTGRVLRAGGTASRDRDEEAAIHRYRSARTRADAKAERAMAEDGFALRKTDDPLMLKRLEALLQTDPQKLGKGKDIQQQYGDYDQLKVACAWKIDNPRLSDKYDTALEKVKNEMEMLETKGKDVDHVPTKTSSVKGFKVDSEINEAILLHGTSPDVLLSILAQGPNERFSVPTHTFEHETHHAV